MNDQNQIPEYIAGLIEQKRQELILEKQMREESKEREQEKLETLGKTKWDEYFQESLQKAPEFMRPYADPTLGEPDFWRIGNGWDNVKSIELHFSIPGLALVTFNPEREWWRTQEAHWSPSWESEPRLEWGDTTKDLPYTLGLASRALREYEQYKADYAEQVQEMIKRDEERSQERAREEAEREADNLESERRIQQAEQVKQAEEQALLDALKDDPAALSLLKAFIFIRQERTGFASQIEDLNDSMYWSEDRWSRRAAELREQADNAQRRADEEKSRLQSDLDEAESKLKKAEHKERYGW